MEFRGQGGQDKFVCTVLDFKKGGFFIEIGAGHWEYTSNSYGLEKELDWKGISIDWRTNYSQGWAINRPNSIFVSENAAKIDYDKLLKSSSVPKNVDYLQIDLEVDNRSTLTTLEKLDDEVFDNYKFAIITFEHDISIGDYHNTREESRKIFTNRGYVLAFPDVSVYCKPWGWCCSADGLERNKERSERTFIRCSNWKQFEDWWVHPDLVDMDRVNKIIDDLSNMSLLLGAWAQGLIPRADGLGMNWKPWDDDELNPSSLDSSSTFYNLGARNL